MSHAQSVLDNIRTLMFVRRVTQAEVAERLGISQPAVSNRLRGRVPLAVDELLTLAELLEVEPSHLLEQAA